MKKTVSAGSRTCSASPVFRASLTVEAAFVLPMFVIMVVLLTAPLRILDEELLLQEQLEKITELECSAGILLTESGGENTEPEETGTENGDDRMIVNTVTEAIELPFSKILPVRAGFYTVTSSRRPWIGREGGAGRAFGEPEEAPPEEEDVTVYVAKNAAKSGKYHLSADCHYISNRVTAVPGREISALRNSDGGKYHRCPVCRPSGAGTVYVFESGDAYHASPSCSALGYFVETMSKKEAEERGLSPCSYCRQNY